MTFQLTNPSSPNTSDALTSLPIRQNFQSIQSFLNAIDGSLIQAGTVGNSALATSVSPVTRGADIGQTFVASGLNPSVPGSGLVVTIPSGVAYVNGVRVASLGGTVTASASSDCYVDMDSSGTFYTSNVTNNTASPSLTIGRIRLMIIVAGASNVASINQGSTTVTAPVVSSNILSVSDSLGNLIYPNTPNPVLIGYRQITSNATTTLNGAAVTGLSCPVIIPTGGRRVKVTHWAGTLLNSTNSFGGIQVFDSTSAANLANASMLFPSGGQSFEFQATAQAIVTPPPGARTYAGYLSTSAGTITEVGSSSTPAFISVELV